MDVIGGRAARAVRIWLAIALPIALGTAMTGTRAGAEASSEVIFSHKAWEVQLVGFDDGSVSCVAQVSDGNRTFSMWSDASELVRLQFYDDSWDLGEGGTADLAVEVDSRGVWTLTNAELYLQSVLFDIPDSDDGIRFMSEVMGGQTLYLSNEDGEQVESYSLSGSRASVGMLIECVNGLKAGGNPFN